MRPIVFGAVLVACMALLSCTGPGPDPDFVVREQGKVYILDKQGQRWDVTGAESIGFWPGGFQYGLGRDAFVPLDDSMLMEKPADFAEHERVIGIVEGDEARAYSVKKLRKHETANGLLAGKPVAVGY